MKRSSPGRGGDFAWASSALAVCAHPDDESFGLGAVLNHLVASGIRASVLCFTAGEASTLSLSDQLGTVRAAELRTAAGELGIESVHLGDHPDGSLGEVPLDRLSREVATMIETVGADVMVVFDEGGVTGHPDHCRATEAALLGAPDVPVLGWCLPIRLGEQLNDEFGTSFVGREDSEIDMIVAVDRTAQRRAIACHASQSLDNPVLWRRLELLGDHEALRWLRTPGR